MDTRPTHIPNISQSKEQISWVSLTLFYMGAALLLGSVVAYAISSWDQMESWERIFLTLGSGTVAYIYAYLTHSNNKYHRVSGPFFLLAAILEFGGGVTTFDEFSTGSDDLNMVLLILMAFGFIQYFITFLELKTGALFFVVMSSALVFVFALCHRLKLDFEIVSIISSLLIIAVTYKISQQYDIFKSLWYFVSSCMLLVSSFTLLDATKLEICYLGVCSLIVYMSTILRSKLVLICGLVAMIMYLSHLTMTYFMASSVWPIWLFIIGVAFIGLGSKAPLLYDKYFRTLNSEDE